MNVAQNVSLANYSTMRLGGVADYLADIRSRAELKEAYEWAKARNLPMIMIGGGSNIYWQDDGFRGLVLVNKIMGYEDLAEDAESHYLTIGAGENWDSVVARSVQAGLTGIEALSLIPGTAGGTPIQNVGAYGQRISDVLTSVETFDTLTGQTALIAGPDCGFDYRTSRFKAADKGRYFIVAITLHLFAGNPQPPFYEALQRYFDEHNITERTPQSVREAVIAIRNSKLPDPLRIANNGSFFANPIISAGDAVQLQADFPGIPCWPTEDGQSYKIPAAWLIENVGMKGLHDPDTGMATWENHALVLVNENAKTTADLTAFKQKIVDAVNAKFHITLVQEPEMLP